MTYRLSLSHVAVFMLLWSLIAATRAVGPGQVSVTPEAYEIIQKYKLSAQEHLENARKWRMALETARDKLVLAFAEVRLTNTVGRTDNVACVSADSGLIDQLKDSFILCRDRQIRQIHELNARVRELVQEQQRAAAAPAARSNCSQNVQDIYEQHQREIVTLDGKINDLQNQLFEVQDDNGKLQARMQDKTDELEVQNRELESQNHELKAQNRELESQNHELKAQNRELESQNHELGAQNRELQRTRGEVNLAQLQAKDQELSGLRQQIAGVRRERDSTKEQLRSKASEAEQLRISNLKNVRVLETQKQTIAELREQVKEVECEREEQTKRAANSEKALKNVAKQVQTTTKTNMPVKVEKGKLDAKKFRNALSKLLARKGIKKDIVEKLSASVNSKGNSRRRLVEEMAAAISFEGLTAEESLMIQALMESPEFTQELESSLIEEGCKVAVEEPVCEVVSSKTPWFKNRFIIALAAAGFLQLLTLCCLCKSSKAADLHQSPRGSMMHDAENPPRPVNPPQPVAPIYSPRLVKKRNAIVWFESPWEIVKNRKKFMSETSKSGINPRRADLAFKVIGKLRDNAKRRLKRGQKAKVRNKNNRK